MPYCRFFGSICRSFLPRIPVLILFLRLSIELISCNEIKFRRILLSSKVTYRNVLIKGEVLKKVSCQNRVFYIFCKYPIYTYISNVRSQILRGRGQFPKNKNNKFHDRLQISADYSHPQHLLETLLTSYIFVVNISMKKKHVHCTCTLVIFSYLFGVFLLEYRKTL